MHDDGRQPIAIGHLGNSGVLKKTNKQSIILDIGFIIDNEYIWYIYFIIDNEVVRLMLIQQ